MGLSVVGLGRERHGSLRDRQSFSFIFLLTSPPSTTLFPVFLACYERDWAGVDGPNTICA